MRHYQHYSHTDNVTNYHCISLPAIVKTVLKGLHTYFCLLLACERIRPHVAKRLPETRHNNQLLYCYSPVFSDQFDVDKNCAPTRARLNKRWVTQLASRLSCQGRGREQQSLIKGLFTWREGAPANRATRLEGLKHSPPLYATLLTRTVSGLRELSLERPLSTTNITADQGNFFPSYFSFLHGHGPSLSLRLIYYIDLFRNTVILCGQPRQPGSTRLHGKKLPRLAGCLGQVDRVPRLGGLPCLAC